MRTRMRIPAIPFLAIILCLSIPAVSASSPGSGSDRSRAVDVVIVLDTSGSMDHLLNSARARIWDVVYEPGLMRCASIRDPAVKKGFTWDGC